MSKYCFKVILLLLLALYPYKVFAGNTGLQGFNIQLFRPTVDGYGLYNTNASRVLPHKMYSIGFYSNYSNNLMSVMMPARNSSIKIIDGNLTGDVLAAVGLFDIFDIGIDVPVVFFENGTNYNDLNGYNTAAFGDMRLDAKFRLLNDDSDIVGLALLSSLTFPTGSRFKFTGDKSVTWEGRLIVDKTYENASLFANIGYRVLEDTSVLSITNGDKLAFSGGANVPLPFMDRSWSFLAEIAGEAVVEDMKEISTPVEIRAGIRKKLNSGIQIDFGGGGGLTSAYGSPGFRLFAGVSYNSAPVQKRMIKKEAPISDIHTVYFRFNSYELSDRQKYLLKPVIKHLKANKPVKILLKGHADVWGEELYNDDLSEKRAIVVKEYLVEQGFAKSLIDIEFYGSSKPLVAEGNLEEQPKNRRVNILIVNP